MKNWKVNKFLVLVICWALCGVVQAQSNTHHYPSYLDFKNALTSHIAQHGQPKKTSADPGSLPMNEQALAGWLPWGPVFISDEPDKCTASSASYDYTYERIDGVDDPAVATCFSINAAERTRSATEAPACDQRNARYFACF